MDFDMWKCQNCGYLVIDIQMQAFKYDYGCPRCEASFSEFTLIQKQVGCGGGEIPLDTTPEPERRKEDGFRKQR